MAERPSELLTCPFCGSSNISRSEGRGASGESWPYIECCDCSACAEPDMWNRRARTLDAAPSEPVSRSQAKRLAVQRASEPSAECWRRAVQAWLGRLIPDNEWDAIEWTAGDFAVDEQRAREIAREGS